MPNFDIKSAVINRFLRLTEVDLESGMVNWVLSSLANLWIRPTSVVF